MKWKDLVLFGKVSSYRISDKGDVYSTMKQRILKGGLTGLTGYNYRSYYLEYDKGMSKWFSSHRLVYESFNGPIPVGYEINHRDLDKLNNHIDNLEATTHSDNMLHARAIKHWDSGRKPDHVVSKSTRERQAAAKHKGVNIYDNNTLVHSCVSIEECSLYLNTYRKKVYRAIKTGKLTRFEADTYRLEFI